ncbi:MAG: Fe-S cluster assembly protein SufD [Tannerella sp.]|nr:Fe-S cluster assembly protein SufD [Tannerella sp.]
MSSAEKQYIDLFTQQKQVICSHAPDIMNQLRTEAFMHFQHTGFPPLKNEDYRYTGISEIFSYNYGLNLNCITVPIHPNDAFRCDVMHLSTLLYFMVNDAFYTKYMSKATLPHGVYIGGMKAFAKQHPDLAALYYGKASSMKNDIVTAINTMFAQDGFVIYVPREVKIERPIQLINLFRSNVDLMANRRILIILAPGAEAKLLVCDHTVDEVKFLSTQVVEIFAEKGAFFDYYDLEENSISATRLSSVYVKQAAGSNVLVNGITLNNGLTRNNYFISLEGEYAETTLCGMGILDRQQQLDTYSHITHAAPDCTSVELFKNVLNNQSTGAFSGRISVEKDAQKTIAYQTNRNMCMTPEARMYSKPQLEIYADDVKCSHGMTTGQLDEQALFYMQSRGLSAEEARMMLSVAFTSDVIDYVRLNMLKTRLHRLVEKRFRGELARCADCRTYKY